jgi:sulfide:quinone oxidoreductase
MDRSKAIIVLGGGIGGVVAATRLRKRLSRKHRVILVEREADYAFSPSFPWVMAGMRSPEAIRRPRTRQSGIGVERIQGEIERIEPQARTVTVNGRELAGDYLVIALGAELAPQTIPGLAEAGDTFYTLDGAQRLNEARRTFRGGRIVVLVASVPFKCPAAPLEAALLLEYDCRKRGVRQDTQVAIYSPEPAPMPSAGPENSRRLRAMLEGRGIAYHADNAVVRVDSSDKRIHFASGETAAFDWLVYVPPHRAPQVVHDAGLVGESGWIPVDRHSLATEFDKVFAIGDVSGIKLSSGKPLPKAGVMAHRQAEVVAHNLVHAITGKGEVRQFDGHGACFIETGGGKAGFGSGDFYAEPAPIMKLRPPGYLMHLGKVAYEKFWLYKWF